LIVDEIGKNISGTGLDTNVIGRIMFIGEKEPEKPKIIRIVVLGLTEAAHGNATGIGLADFTTQYVIDKMDTQAMATNAITAMSPEKARIPIGLATDQAAVEAALQTIGAIEAADARVIHIKNTLEIGTMHISSALKKEMTERADLMLLEDIGSLSFDTNGKLTPITDA